MAWSIHTKRWLADFCYTMLTVITLHTLIAKLVRNRWDGGRPRKRWTGQQPRRWKAWMALRLVAAVDWSLPKFCMKPKFKNSNSPPPTPKQKNSSYTNATHQIQIQGTALRPQGFAVGVAHKMSTMLLHRSDIWDGRGAVNGWQLSIRSTPPPCRPQTLIDTFPPTNYFSNPLYLIP